MVDIPEHVRESIGEKAIMSVREMGLTRHCTGGLFDGVLVTLL
jgi:hypothetical protein